MWLFLHLQSEGHGGGSFDTQMKHSGGSSVGKVSASWTGTTREFISAGSAASLLQRSASRNSTFGFSGRDATKNRQRPLHRRRRHPRRY
jgi:ribosomal protein L34